ncbi:hypothetical protein RDWZM_009565 [Blomia tropicalis]|uniref:Inosine triphosphate pyrophosphatase n=1 Tax=Blomia tropicalis TaxID=40697 RepID=A0A9Q0RJU3_BLOTA|nr:hypothetical protein RDWZM_009565 [Blomia tropicalis]
MKRLTIITGNLAKLKEIVDIIGDNVPFEIIHQNIDLPEYQGDIDFIVSEKCKAAAKIVDGPVLVEDTSLCIDCLNGLPGPYVKWFLETIGSIGLYRMVKDWKDKSATAICSVAFCEGPQCDVQVFKGTLRGKIIEPRGNGFGFPCFLPDGFEKTLAEMDDQERNQISHRFKCLNEFRLFLLQLGG